MRKVTLMALLLGFSTCFCASCGLTSQAPPPIDPRITAHCAEYEELENGLFSGPVEPDPRGRQTRFDRTPGSAALLAQDETVYDRSHENHPVLRGQIVVIDQNVDKPLRCSRSELYPQDVRPTSDDEVGTIAIVTHPYWIGKSDSQGRFYCLVELIDRDDHKKTIEKEVSCRDWWPFHSRSNEVFDFIDSLERVSIEQSPADEPKPEIREEPKDHVRTEPQYGEQPKTMDGSNPTADVTPDPAFPNMVPGGVLNGRALNLPKPAYPSAARADPRATGLCTVRVIINEAGKVISAAAVSCHPLLAAAAVSAAKQAIFSPTLVNGKPMKVSGVVTYTFAP